MKMKLKLTRLQKNEIDLVYAGCDKNIKDMRVYIQESQNQLTTYYYRKKTLTVNDNGMVYKSKKDF